MKQVKLSPLLFLLVFSYMLIEGSFRPLGVLGFSLLHELGHVAVIWLLGGRITGFFGRGQGFGLSFGGLSYGGELLAALAGPAVSLLLGATFTGLALWQNSRELAFCAFANLALGALNLLPIVPLDGGRVLRALLLLYCTPDRARAVGNGVGICVLLPLLGVAFWQFLSSGYNLSLLFVCFYLIGLIGVNGYDV